MKPRLSLITLLALAGCVDAAPASDEPNVSTLDQELQSCTASCDAPTYNGVSVSCTSNIVCVSESNGVGCLDDDQTTVNIVYCQPLVCGDGVCTRPYEDAQSCSLDCGCPTGQAACCDDGLCHPLFVCTKDLCPD
jgi:hypothetical protein